MASAKSHARVHYSVLEHKPERLADGCHCGLQAGHPGEHQTVIPKVGKP